MLAERHGTTEDDGLVGFNEDEEEEQMFQEVEDGVAVEEDLYEMEDGVPEVEACQRLDDMSLRSASRKKNKSSKRKKKVNQIGNQPKMKRSSNDDEPGQSSDNRGNAAVSLDYNTGSFRSAAVPRHPNRSRHTRPGFEPYLVNPSNDPYLTRPTHRPSRPPNPSNRTSGPPPGHPRFGPPPGHHPSGPPPGHPRVGPPPGNHPSGPPPPPARWREGYQERGPPSNQYRPCANFQSQQRPRMDMDSRSRDTYRRPDFDPRTRPSSGFGIYRNLPPSYRRR
eukprot:sb/3467956/